MFGVHKRSAPDILLHTHVRTDLAVRGSTIDDILSDLNGHIERRGGIVLADGQILTVPLQASWVLDEHYSDDTTSDWDHPLREWGKDQTAYFASLWASRGRSSLVSKRMSTAGIASARACQVPICDRASK